MSGREQFWESGWAGHDRAQRKRLAALSFVEKLVWLEEAHRVASQLGSTGAASRVCDGKQPRPAPRP